MLLLHLFGTMSIWLKFLAKRNPREFFVQIKDVLVTAFSTSSSSATLPAALAACRERLGIAPSTAGFVMPLGTTMNMSGTALYEGCVVLFVAQVFGVHLGLAEQVTLVFLSVLSAVAVAAIPAFFFRRTVARGSGPGRTGDTLPKVALEACSWCASTRPRCR